MAKSSKSTAVAQVEENALVFQQSEVPDYINKGAARGSEEVKSSDMVLPRLELVQAQSPIKEENEEAREGMLFNSVTQELYGDNVYVVPIYFRLEYLVWRNQELGGGFHGSFPTKDEAMLRYKELIAAEPNLSGETNGKPNLEVVDTPVHFCLRITPDLKREQIVISMSKSKSKVSRKWNAMIQIAGGDRFGRVYKISSVTDENKQGKKFKNFVVAPAGFPPKEIYQEAEMIYEGFRSGAFSVDHASVINVDDEAGSGGDGIDRGGI